MVRRPHLVSSDDDLSPESPSSQAPEGTVGLLKPGFWRPPASTKDLEIHGGRLIRRIEALEADNRRLKEVLESQVDMLADEVEFLEEFLSGPASTTYESLRRRVSRLKGARDRGK